MKMTFLICPIIVVSSLNLASAESLERRFGPDREKGHRSEREFEGARGAFRNRDRANFLGVKHDADTEESSVRPDLHLSPRIGLQR